MTPYLAPHALTHTKVAQQVDIIEQGNWKLTIENNRECFHCAGHPELLSSLFDFFGEVDAQHLSAQEHAHYCRYLARPPESEALWQRFGLPWQPIEELRGRPTGFRTERLVLDGAGESMTPDTRAASRRLLGRIHRGAPGHAALSRAAECLVSLPRPTTYSPSQRCPWRATARWCAAPGSCTRDAVEGRRLRSDEPHARLERHQCAGCRFRRRDAARGLESCLRARSDRGERVHGRISSTPGTKSACARACSFEACRARAARL